MSKTTRLRITPKGSTALERVERMAEWYLADSRDFHSDLAVEDMQKDIEYVRRQRVKTGN